MTQAQQLAAPFDEALLGDDGSGNTVVPVAEVVGRLNTALGVSGWSYEVISCERDTLEPEWWVAHVRLTAEVDGKTCVRDGYGGADTNRKRNDKTAFAVDNDVKSAVSSALKKAAWHLDVGRYLSRKDSAVRHDAQQPAPEITDEQLSDITHLLAKLGEEAEAAQAKAFEGFKVSGWDELNRTQADNAIRRLTEKVATRDAAAAAQGAA